MVLAGLVGSTDAATGTFVDRDDPDDVRVVSYNMFTDSWFEPGPGGGPTWVAAPHMERIVAAVDADVWNFQEVINRTAAEVVAVMDQIVPLPSGSWFGHKARNQVTVSRYPLSMLDNDVPLGQRGIAMGLVDLPDERFSNDLYVLNNHFPCCDNEAGRIHEADAIVSWMHDATAPGGSVTLPTNTAIAVLGDLNIVGSGQALQTLLTGDITNEQLFGPDGPPDWDGTDIANAHPFHNGTLSDDYTWRSDPSSFDPGRLDYILYTDSVIDVGNMFVLNTMAMTPTDLALTGLQAPDVMRNMSQPQLGDFDHLPVVVDFLANLILLPGDANNDGQVTGADLIAVQQSFGNTGPADGLLLGDANDDGQVTGADLISVQQNFGATASPLVFGAGVPEPTGLVCWLLLTALAGSRRHRQLS